MRTNIVKEKLSRGEIAWGTWVTLADERVALSLAQMGFDWLTIDMEHTSLEWGQVERLIAAVLEGRATPFVRVPSGDEASTKRALDLGAFGLVIPMVESSQQAQAVAAACRYPPLGRRSAAAALHHLRWQASLEDYLSRANQEVMVILQIESVQGIKQVTEIAAQEGCDALFVGPLDLSVRIRAQSQQPATGQPGIPPEFDSAEPSRAASEGVSEVASQQAFQAAFEEAVCKVIAAGQQLGRATGFHARDVTEALHWAEKGMRLLAVGSDLVFLRTEACNVLQRVQQIATSKSTAENPTPEKSPRE